MIYTRYCVPGAGTPYIIPLPGWRSLILTRTSASFRGVSMVSSTETGLAEEDAGKQCSMG
jgi:hypothetical protein